MLEILISFLLVAIVVEYLTGVIAPFIPETTYPVSLIISMVLGVLICIICRVDLLTGLGLSVSVPMISYIISGLAASGGSKAAHELIAKLRASREDINE